MLVGSKKIENSIVSGALPDTDGVFCFLQDKRGCIVSVKQDSGYKNNHQPLILNTKRLMVIDIFPLPWDSKVDNHPDILDAPGKRFLAYFMVFEITDRNSSGAGTLMGMKPVLR